MSTEAADIDPQELRRFEACLQRGFVPSGSVVTSWVLVTEHLQADDDRRYLSITTADDVSPWQRDGMLHHALDMAEDDDI